MNHTPQATHEMYLQSDNPPLSATDEHQARLCLERFEEQGYEPIAGVMMVQTMTVRQGVRLHEKGELYLRQGYLIGPYFSEGRLVCNAFKFFRLQSDA